MRLNPAVADMNSDKSPPPAVRGEGQGAAVQSRHNDAKVSTETMAPDRGGGP